MTIAGKACMRHRPVALGLPCPTGLQVAHSSNTFTGTWLRPEKGLTNGFNKSTQLTGQCSQP